MTSALKLKLTAALFTGLCGVLVMPTQASAFCGFYVSSNDAPLYNSATQVVMMREGVSTVLSMRNNYSGPAEDFAMVIPVPVVLQEADVKTLDDALFARLNNFTQPRLVEYYEKNPCENANRMRMQKNMEFSSMPMEEGSGGDATAEPLVMVEAQFEVGEYEIVVLSAKESTALETWLKTNKYNIPEGASEVLQSYIAQGMYFFVAKVNSDKVTFDEAGSAVLSPLRFSFDSENFELPVRLGLLNADGAQDLLVHIISREGRFRVSNGENITIPTNLIVDESVKGKFTHFYDKLFTRVHEENPAAIVTEYAWGGPGLPGQTWTLPVKCDPCTEDPATSQGPLPWANALMSFGADRLPAPEAKSGSGTMTASASAMAIDAQVTPKTVTPPTTEVSPDGEPSTTPPTSAPPATITYDLNGVQPIIMEQTSKLGTCYEKLNAQRGKQPEVMDVHIAIKPDGSVAGVESAEQSDEWRQRVKMLASCADMGSLVFPAPEGGASVKTLVRLQFDVSYVDSSWLAINKWTITRLHARYTADQLENDLYFTSAPPIEGGRGTPKGQDPTMRTTAVSSDVNNFQARYMVLHPYTSWHMCMNPEPGDWTGSGAQGASTNMTGAPKLEENEELSVMQVVKSERGWLKKAKKNRKKKSRK